MSMPEYVAGPAPPERRSRELPAGVREVRDYAKRVLTHWWAWLGGIGVAAALFLLAALRWSLPQWGYVAIVFAGFAVSQFQTWHDERRHSQMAIAQEHGVTEAERRKLEAANDTIVQLMGGDFTITSSPQLAQHVAQAFGKFRLSGGEIALLLLMTKSALAGMELEYFINPKRVGNQPPEAKSGWYELSFRDKNQPPTGGPLAGVVAGDITDLREVEMSHRQLVARLRAEHFQP